MSEHHLWGGGIVSKALHKGKYGGRSRSTIVAAVCAALLGGVIFASSQAYANPISDLIKS